MLLCLMLTCVSCTSPSDIEGQWQLVQYCYGNDCVLLSDHNIKQMWTFADSGKGCQVQEGVMDNEIRWSLSAEKDTLFTSMMDGSNADTLFVSYFEADTLELSSLLNNILVRQRFVRI